MLHNYAHIFDLLSRLRQAVDHPYLVIHGNDTEMASAGAAIPTRSAGVSDVCGLCLEDIAPKHLSVTACKHTFHKKCIQDLQKEHKERLKDAADEAKEAVKEAKAKAKAEGKDEPKAAKAKAKAKADKKAVDKDKASSPPGGGVPKLCCPVCYQDLSIAIDLRGLEDEVEQGSKQDGGDDANTCVICLEAPRDAVLLPCGHVMTCMSCTEKLESRVCPMCRKAIKQVASASSGAAASAAASGTTAATAAPAAKALKLGRRNILQNVKLAEFASSTKVFGCGCARVCVCLSSLKPKSTMNCRCQCQYLPLKCESVLLLKRTPACRQSKVDSVLAEIKAMRKKDDTSKAIIFSQYSSMLDIVEWSLHKAGIKCVKFLGTCLCVLFVGFQHVCVRLPLKF